MKLIPCANGNYKVGRSSAIQYIVVHYTANNGDTAAGNCKYFQTAGRGASAHYFVDENEVIQSVADHDTAYHCGAKSYAHAWCRNANSIGVEMCSRKDGNGNYYFKQETIDNSAAIIRGLMKKYQIPSDCVIRHYDVTRKKCPAPFVENPAAWTEFKRRIEVQPMTVAEAKAILAQKAGLSDATITFLACYKYADELLIKLASAMK